MADAPLVWDDLAKYKAEGRFLDGYPDDQRTFFAPRDDIHGLLVALLGSAQHSIVVNMFGYDDDELNKIIQSKLADEKIYVQMSLDRSQATGAHEKQILASWGNDAFGNSIAIGTSSVHDAISHLKIVIVDGVYTVKGSTNWSLSGEQQQDNELSLSRNAVAWELAEVAAYAWRWLSPDTAGADADGQQDPRPGKRRRIEDVQRVPAHGMSVCSSGHRRSLGCTWPSVDLVSFAARSPARRVSAGLLPDLNWKPAADLGAAARLGAQVE